MENSEPIHKNDQLKMPDWKNKNTVHIKAGRKEQEENRHRGLKM